ncbi:hypothetical protein QQ045_015232 [Rhodiola kirilowii]
MSSLQPEQTNVVVPFSPVSDQINAYDQCPPEKLQLFDNPDQYLSLEKVSPPKKPILDTQEQNLSWEVMAVDDPSPIFNTEGLRVLAVDDSLVCLKVLVALLHQCKYNVTETTNPVEALQILRMRKHEFDIVITDLRMLEMDGLVLLQKISLEMDLPVVMLSADDNQQNIMKAIRYGARDYIIKPPRMAQIKNVWQHVVRKHLFGPGCKDGNNNNNNSSSVTIEETDQSPPPVVVDKRKLTEIEKGKTDEEAASTWNGDNSDVAAKKKRRVNWTVELHNKFIDAIEKIGHNAVPMQILKVMNVPGLTRANVASHLQKFKNAFKAQSTPHARNDYSNSVNSAGQIRCQSSFSSTNAYSMGTMSYGTLPTQAIVTSSNFPQKLPYQRSIPNHKILPLGSNQHLSRIMNHNQRYNLPMNPSGYQAPTMLNSVPLPSRNVLTNMQSHPPLPRFNGPMFSTLGTMSNNNLANSYSYSSALPSNMHAASAWSLVNVDAQQNDNLGNGKNFVGIAKETQNVFPQHWTAASELQDTLMSNSDTKASTFDVDPFQTPEMETWSMNNKFIVDPAHTTPQEELPIDASFLQPITTNLSDDDDNELNSIVNSVT